MEGRKAAGGTPRPCVLLRGCEVPISPSWWLWLGAWALRVWPPSWMGALATSLPAGAGTGASLLQQLAGVVHQTLYWTNMQIMILPDTSFAQIWKGLSFFWPHKLSHGLAQSIEAQEMPFLPSTGKVGLLLDISVSQFYFRATADLFSLKYGEKPPLCFGIKANNQP